MCSESNWLVRVMRCACWLLLVVAGTGCDAIKSVTDKQATPDTNPAPTAPTAPTTQAPATPAPAEPVAPAPVAKTPQQIIDEFLALPSVEKRDETLKQVAELKEGLDAITTLDLTRSGVSDEGMKSLLAFPKLAELNLSDTRVSNAGLASVAEVKSLRALKVANQRGVDDLGIKALAPLKDLESLTVNGCAVTDTVLPILAEFEGLQVLNLSGNTDIYGRDFKVLASQGAFRNLRELHVGGSRFGYYGLEQINKLSKLEVLRASGCELAGAAINGLAGCDRLKVLDLSRNLLQDDNIKGVSRLKGLEELRLGGTNVTDDCLNSLKTMKNLKILDLGETRVTEKAIRLLKEKFLKDTEILALGQKF